MKQYHVNETLKANYHGTEVTGTILSSRQQWRGNNHPSTTTYTIKPDCPVMGEAESRDRLVISEDLITT